ncbi:hypothetical protein P5V15_002378 [Pogonomyrmex californicus]
MRAFYTILMFVILASNLAECWSFSDVATSLERLIRQSNTSQMLNFTGTAASTPSPEVTVEGRIIFVPRRTNIVTCQPGQQADRRGKCRTVW